jgi:hypothetical protein
MPYFSTTGRDLKPLLVLSTLSKPRSNGIDLSLPLRS